jgi:hypothetical protein
MERSQSTVKIDWDRYRNDGKNMSYGYWSPSFGFQKNMKVTFTISVSAFGFIIRI